MLRTPLPQDRWNAERDLVMGGSVLQHFLLRERKADHIVG
jgi:hypothetical protein